MKSTLDLFVVANTRLPSERAQALQVVQSSAAFARAGATTQVLYADRKERGEARAPIDVFEHYAVPPGARPSLLRIACVDWIERVPVALQFWPARVQELTFSRNAARHIAVESASAFVLSREIECARALVRGGRRRVFLELHRVPEGNTRRRWLLEAARGLRGIVAISGGVRDDLLAMGLATDAITVEHDGFEPARFANPPTRSEARVKLGLDERASLVVYTGGLLAWKGVDVLVDAARLAPEIQFVIAGGMRDDVERLRERARGAPNVRIDGFQPPDSIALYLAAGDLGVVPNRAQPAISARYTSPLKIFEAMASGLPLVASDLPSLRELLTDGTDAWLVAPEDPNALVRGLRDALGNSVERARRAARFAARADRHTWDARARRILDWMQARGA